MWPKGPTERKIIEGPEIKQPPLARKEEKEEQEMKADLEESQWQMVRQPVALEKFVRHLILVC